MVKVFSYVGAIVGIVLMAMFNPVKGESQFMYMVVGAIFGGGGSLLGSLIGAAIENATTKRTSKPADEQKLL